MDNKSKTTKENTFFAILVAAVFASFFIFDMTNASSWSIVVELGILLAVYSFLRRGKIIIKLTEFHKRIIIFGVFCVLSALWAWLPSKAIESGVTVLEMLVCAAVLFLFYQDSKNVDGVLTSVMWSGIIVILYMVMQYGIETLNGMAERAERLGSDIANPNMVAIWISFCAVIVLHRILNGRFKIPYLAIIPMVLFIGMLQSRTALFVMVAGIVLVLYFKATEKGSTFSKAFKFLIIVAAFLVVANQISQLSAFSGINDRIRVLFGLSAVRKESSSELRNTFVQIGMKQFFKTPVLGIGISSTPELTSMYTSHYTYLHNNYVEMLTSGGIIGFCIYYSIYLYAFVRLFKQRKKEKGAQLCLILLIMLAASDLGTVSYYKKYTYVILLACYLCIYYNSASSGSVQHEEKT